MEFFNSAIGVLQTLVIALGAGLGIWGVINLLEGYGNDNPGAKSQGIDTRSYFFSCDICISIMYQNNQLLIRHYISNHLWNEYEMKLWILKN